MPAARGVKRTASKAAEVKPVAGTSKSKKKPEPKAPLISGDLKVPKGRGDVFTVGQGDVGQLGLGEDYLEKSRFTRVTALPSTIVDIKAGGMHTVAIDKDGNVWTFGCNDEGALGRDTEGPNSEWVPSKVQLPGKAVSVSAGDSHTAALLTTAQVFAWGSFRDSHGNMGLTLKGNERKPVEMLPGHRVVQIASGGDHLVMLTETGQVYTCGCGEQGQLGRVTARSCDRHSRMGLNGLLVPAPLVFSRDKVDFEAVWAGTHCTFARRHGKGDIYVWGLNNYQQIGVRKGSPQTVFTPMISEAFSTSPAEKWTHISGGQHHTLAIDDKGQCYSLGRNEYGRLGLGAGCEDAKDLTPVPVLAGKRCVSVSCGSATSYAVTSEGETWVWGMGSSGALGTGGEEDEPEPKLLAKGALEKRKATIVSAGGQHTVLLVASESSGEDEVMEAEKGDTGPNTKVEDEAPMDVDEQKEEKSEEVVEEKKGGRKAPAKRGRKRSNSTSSNTDTKQPNKKQNGGSPVPEETSKEVSDAEKDVEPTTQEEKSQPSEEEKPQQQPGADKRSADDDEQEASDEPEGPKSKKIKLDDKAVAETVATEPKEKPEIKPEEDKEEKEPVKECADEKMDVEEKLSNGNGDAEDEAKPAVEEVKSVKEAPEIPAVTTEEKKEDEKMETATSTTEVVATS